MASANAAWGGRGLSPPVLIGDDDGKWWPDVIAHYHIKRQIGRGGMGCVFEADNLRLCRREAIKLIHPRFSGSVDMGRLMTEAMVLASLGHPNIARVYDADTVTCGGRRVSFITMELIEGATLMEHVRDARLSEAERVRLFLKVCGAVEHAHESGVIHRDLKPANILVDRRGEPQVLDFGLATTAALELTEGLMESAGRSAIGVTGTLEYMSPEQANIDGRRATRQSDVYALGVMLYEMLSGRRARRLDGMTVLGAVQAVRASECLHLDPKASGRGGRLQKIVARATAVEPADRYATVADLSDEVETYLEDVVSADEKVAWRTRTVAAAVTLLVMSSWIGGYSVSESTERPRAFASGPAPASAEGLPADDVASVKRTAVAERAHVVEELVSRCGSAGAAAIRGECFLEVALEEPMDGTEALGREEYEGWVRSAAGFFVRARVLLVAESPMDRTRARLFDLRIALCQAALGDVKPARQTYWAVLAETKHDFELASALGITSERLRKALHLPAPAPVLPATVASPFNPTSPGSPSRGSMNGGGASSGQ